MDEREDLVRDTLLLTRAEIAPDLDEKLVLQCYRIEERHQYDRDRSAPYYAIKRLVEDFLDRDDAEEGI